MGKSAYESTTHFMQILLVTNLYPPQELGGYGRSMADFAWGLMQRGHHVQVLCADVPHLGDSGNGPSGEPVSRCLTLKGSFEGGVLLDQNPERCRACDAANQNLISRWLNKCDWDGVLVGNIDLLGLETLQPLIDADMPLLHHIGFVTPPFDPTLTPQATRYQLVCASQTVKKNLIQAGMDVTTAPVVYPGARVELYGNQINGRSLPALPSPSKQHPLKICFAGLQMSSKGPHTLLEAIALMKSKNIPTYCMFAGGVFQKTYMQAMYKFIDAQNLKNNIQFVPQLTRQQLSRFFRLHHVCVFPSIHPEAFGIVAAEAMASGLALVSSGVGGAAEVFEDGISGLCFQAGNASSLATQLERLWRNPELLKTLQKNGEKRARERFSVQRSAEDLETLLVQLKNQSPAL